MTHNDPYPTATAEDRFYEERARLITKLGAADARIWRLKELLGEFIAVHHEPPNPDAVDHILRLDRLCLEAQTVLDSLPDVVRLPISGEVLSEGEVGGASPAGGAA